ncbi:hypothetical protein B0A55_07755 [Friedmanniomyces simplex]|uniref:Amidohydrolase-related domain-containing protein n=1 Tax=Friedmanniomyces simplex TaxID=329884 RepID=A0A4U0X7P2_9PEZI|nr:hypothetical protein B0A55_07755 [Friedmanniomyces simplex]
MPYTSYAWSWPKERLLKELPSAVASAGLKMMALMGHYYTPNEKDSTKPLAWPYHANEEDVKRLPPHYLAMDELDPLRDEGMAYYHKLSAAGVTVAAHVNLGVAHGSWGIFGQAIPEMFQAAVDSILYFPSSYWIALLHLLGECKCNPALGHVDFQIVSQVTGIANWRDFGSCQTANDELAEMIRKAPTRLGGFAALCMTHPEKASQELERAVTHLGLLGAMIDNHLPDMTHYDSERFWPVFRVAERLDVPIYLHPSPVSEEVMSKKFHGNYPNNAAAGLATGAWGWHEDVGLHVVKLYAAGLFTRFPKLKIIIGHMGEMIPIMIDRIDKTKFFNKADLGSFRDVWERNIWVTTSGIFSVRTLQMLLQVTPLDHVLYSIDTPFDDCATGWEFVEEISRQGLLSKAELEQFVSGNARSLFTM